MPYNVTTSFVHEHADAYTSANHHKYVGGGPLYHFFLGRFHRCLDAMVAATRPRTLLDAGCGEGFIAHYLKQRHPGWQITGCDVSAPAIRYARQHASTAADFQVGSLYDLPLAADAFDTVLCSEVLEHLEHPDQAVAELKRVARRFVVVTVPREPYFRALSALGQVLGRSPDPGHVNFWTARGFETFMEEHFEQPAFERVHIFQLAAARVGGPRAAWS